ncbi:MAG: sensor histidine kinase N-terminal domain-containing protein, partial [Dokdonella sp.]
MATEAAPTSAAPPSLRKQLLKFLIAPLAVILFFSALASYILALHYANRVYDRVLLETARTLERLTRSQEGEGALSPQARILLESDTADASLFAVRSVHHGLLAGSEALGLPDPLPVVDGEARYWDTSTNGTMLRAVSVAIGEGDPIDTIVVSVAETLRQRHALTREILVATIPIELLVIAAVLAMVWLGVTRGLGLLDPL